MQTEKLIQALIEQTKQSINQVEKLKPLEISKLSWRENERSWNILECLEHLNLYGDFYLPEFTKKIDSSSTDSDVDFKTGLLGNYFAKSMLPKEKLNKMKTFKDKNPLGFRLDRQVIDRFLTQQFQLLDILHHSRNVNLNRVKIATSISSLIKLKLGDAFQFYSNHIVRHLAQIEKIKQRQKID